MQAERTYADSGDASVCWAELPKVSRSFALCIQVLPDPIREQIMVSYLLYRIIDTIEDSDASIATKKEMFDLVLRLMNANSFSEKKTAAARDRLLDEIRATPEETGLLAELGAVLRVYFAQPREIRRAIARWGGVMADGMHEFLTREISTFRDQNKYSYYVAGVVGYLINDVLYYNKVIDAKLRRRLRVHARNFGLALQKVNILRDVAKDLREGRRYWPSHLIRRCGLTYEELCLPENRKKALHVLREYARESLGYLHSAMFYVVSLPKKAVRVRMFCIIPLFMAIESFAKCNGNSEIFDAETRVKISRMKVYEIVAKSGLMGSFNGLMIDWFYGTLGRDLPVPANSPLLQK